MQGIFVISLVHHQHGAGGRCFQHACKLRRIHHAAHGVGWIGQESDLGCQGHGCAPSINVKAQFCGQIKQLYPCPHHARVDLVQAEHGALSHHQIAEREKHLAKDPDQVFRTVAEYQAVCGHAAALGNYLAQCRALGIWIVANIIGQACQSLAHGGAGAVRVFVAGQACDVGNAKACSHGLVGQARIVGGQG
ncbi:hypothetical protein D3C72_932790 [compost metagenome]